MRLSPAAFAVTAAVVWGAAILVIGGINALVPGYGETVLALVASIYPGYEASGSLGALLLGTSYAFFDGLAGGFVFALLYNTAVRFTATKGETTTRVAVTTEVAPSAPEGSASGEVAPPEPTPLEPQHEGD